jgi:Uri superfamily endonuclease
MIETIPSLPGSYALHLVVPTAITLSVGRLGQIDFPLGDYFYLGSAWGPGGLRARILHHLRAAAKPHWHIDWLRQNARLAEVWYSTDLARLECVWSQALLDLPGVVPAAPRFGASDCRRSCAAHLVRLPTGFNLDSLPKTLCAVLGGVGVSELPDQPGFAVPNP